jgi:hypothetical protein
MVVNSFGNKSCMQLMKGLIYINERSGFYFSFWVNISIYYNIEWVLTHVFQIIILFEISCQKNIFKIFQNIFIFIQNKVD